MVVVVVVGAYWGGWGVQAVKDFGSMGSQGGIGNMIWGEVKVHVQARTENSSRANQGARDSEKPQQGREVRQGKAV